MRHTSRSSEAKNNVGAAEGGRLEWEELKSNINLAEHKRVYLLLARRKPCNRLVFQGWVNICTTRTHQNPAENAESAE
jgi:hypothetical protein